MSDKDDVLSGTPFSGDQQNTNEQDPDVLFGSQRQNLEDTDDREALESNESSRVGSVQVNYQQPLKANRRLVRVLAKVFTRAIPPYKSQLQYQ